MSTNLIKLPDVMKLTTLSRASVYRLIQDNVFPKPIKLSTRSVAWVVSDIEDWIQSKTQTIKDANHDSQ